MGGDGTLTYRLEDYSYQLPPELIAQGPVQVRDSSRLLVLDRSSSRIEHYRFRDLTRFLRRGDMLVVNDTRVVPARLVGRKETGGIVELLILDPYKDPARGLNEGYRCLVKTSKRPRPGTRIDFSKDVSAVFVDPVVNGTACVRFDGVPSLQAVLAEIGQVPLPPYIGRSSERPPVDDATAYQTIYGLKPGAVAAPTAGLHFSSRLLKELEKKGIARVPVTLHVGHGTFSPVRTEDVREHRMHREYIELSPDSAGRIREAKEEGRRIVAVGTTVVRTLEWVARKFDRLQSYSGFCDHYIYPGYQFRIVEALVTNFHLPRSSLLLLVSAFAGRERILLAYEEAIRQRYRFFSYGDAMLIL